MKKGMLMSAWFLVVMGTIFGSSIYSLAKDRDCEEVLRPEKPHRVVIELMRRRIEHTDFRDAVIIYPDRKSKHFVNKVAAEIEDEFGLILILLLNRTKEMREEGLLEARDNLVITDPEIFMEKMELLKPEVFRLALLSRAAFQRSANNKTYKAHWYLGDDLDEQSDGDEK